VSANAAAEVAARLRVIRDRAATRAPVAAATAAGKAGETKVKMVLQLRTHEAGTPTPSPKGAPPAKVSGDMARSVQRVPTALAGVGRAVTMWGPTVIYGPVHEYGATVTARNFPQLGNPEVGFFGPQVKIPKRPFMAPSTRRLIESGMWTRVTGTAFVAALET